MKDQHDNKTVDWVGVPRNDYAESFEVLLDILLFTVFAGRSITWMDLQENVVDKTRWTLNRYLNSLVGLGYLERCERKLGRNLAYMATEKSKQLFGVK